MTGHYSSQYPFKNPPKLLKKNGVESYFNFIVVFSLIKYQGRNTRTIIQSLTNLYHIKLFRIQTIQSQSCPATLLNRPVSAREKCNP